MLIRRLHLEDFSKNLQISESIVAGSVSDSAKGASSPCIPNEENEVKLQDKTVEGSNSGQLVQSEARSVFTEATKHSVTLSLEELKKIKAKAFFEGKQEGLSEAIKHVEHAQVENFLQDKVNDLEHQALQTVLEIRKNLDTIDEQRALALHSLSEECVLLAYAIGKRIIEHLCEYVPENLILDFLRKKLPLLTDEALINVDVNPDCLKLVQDKFPKMLLGNKYNFKFTLIPDLEIAPGDCKIRWEGGAFIKNKEMLLQGLDELLGDYLNTKSALREV
ncbi:hypothetical protein MIDIC_310032 [Alphaproteobacteria bacterium]